MIERRLITIHGIVQGVGFRPFVMNVARTLELRGSVRNDSEGVLLDFEGDAAAFDRLIDRIARNAPPLSRIESIATASAEVVPHHDLRIIASDTNGERQVQVTPDAATCDACIAELFDAGNRRYRHPFISCTDCGPRLTISHDAPYDRERTTMAHYVICTDCRREYEDPFDRRFHAQTIACSSCGPTLRFEAPSHVSLGDIALCDAVAALRHGATIAVKGIGGYHLACSAVDADAVHRLRARKRREAKPFAVMVKDLAAAHGLCVLTDAEAALLRTSMRPIVLLEKRPETLGISPALDALAPTNRRLGVMLPYSPVHHLLLADFGAPLVMTSGNLSDEPIAIDDADAQERLHGIADAFLVHDRTISTRCDDSVVRVVRRQSAFVRRSRGAAPAALAITPALPAPVLAVGGHLKNTFCLARGGHAFLSHHIGDLENVAAYRALTESIEFYERLLGVEPAVVAHDMHPDYLSTRLAHELNASEHIGVQHHHAHVASCLAEHSQREPVLGIVFDGAGYGSDGAVWGGEFLLADQTSYERLAHLEYVPLPGGDAAARQPWRMAVSHLLRAYGGDVGAGPLPFAAEVAAAQIDILTRMLRARVQSPPTSSVGRLFDAVASLAGIRHVAQYEAQAAMELEAMADPTEHATYPFDVNATSDGWTIDVRPLIRGIMHDVARKRTPAHIAAAFHNAVRDFTVDVAERVRRRTHVRRAALTGGVFQNALLSDLIAGALEQRGFDVLLHRQVPCNDGGIALGQALVAARTCHAATRTAVCA